MKKKTKIILAVATLAIFSLTITAYHWQAQVAPPSRDVRPMSALTERSRDNTPPTQGKAVVSDESPEIITQSKDLPEPITTEPVLSFVLPYSVCLTRKGGF